MVSKRVAEWTQATQKVCYSLILTKPLDNFQRVTEDYNFVVEVIEWHYEQRHKYVMRTHAVSGGLTVKEAAAQAVQNKGCINILIQKLPEGSNYRTHYP